MKCLLIKMSSMGDVIHTYPALTDAMNAIPGLQVDWVIEEKLADLAKLHPAIHRVIPIGLRRWRRSLLHKSTWQELFRFRQDLQETHYDLVIDAQGLLKSAGVAWLARGKKAGFSSDSAREPLAAKCYDMTYSVPRHELAITRLRRLFSEAFQYALPTSEPQFGLNRATPLLQQTPSIFLLHGTTWASKSWPLTHWIALSKHAIDAGYAVRTTGGNEAEMEFSEQIAKGAPGVQVLPSLSIQEMIVTLNNSVGVVTVDTGLGHLSSAMSIPTVGIYGSTDWQKTGVTGARAKSISAQFECSPCMKRECFYTKPSMVKPACYGTVLPKTVWETLQSLMSSDVFT